MKIGIYAQPLTYSKPTGISGYTRGLINSLLSEDCELVLYYEHSKTNHERVGFDNHPLVKKRGLIFPGIHRHPRWWWDFYLPLWLKFDKIEVFHGPNHVVPKTSVPTVCTIHDLAYYHMEIRGTGMDRYLQRWTQRSMNLATKVITVSNSTRNDCIEAGIEEGKITTVYQGFTSPTTSNDSVITNIAKPRVDITSNSYFLFVGTIQPRKNIPHLIREYASISEATDWDLVIAGSPSDDQANVAAAIDENKLWDRVHMLGFVDESTRRKLFQNASCFVYPSKYEGFGLPVLEAMAARVPVIASNNSSLPEAVGPAGLLVNTSTKYELANAMKKISSNPHLRDHLIQLGQHHIRSFAWDRCAAETLAVYEQALRHA